MNGVNLRRALKYFLFLAVLYLVIVTVLCATGMSAVPFGEMGYALFHTWRGGLLLLMAVGMAVAYPVSGFVRREAAADFTADRQRIVDIFASAGFVLTGESAGMMSFRAASAVRRLRLLGEDEITVTPAGAGHVAIEGIRRVAVPVAFRVDAAARGAKM